MLIWDKHAVKNKKEISERGKILARHFNPIKVPKEVKGFFRGRMKESRLRNPLRKVGAIASGIRSTIEYDYDHHHLGERNAIQTALQEEGECIEKFCLLTAACDASVPEIAGKKGILIAKNPHKYEGGSIEEPGFHAFLTVKHKGVEYIVDDCCGVRPKKSRDVGWNACTYLTRREFTAHWLTYTAEDLGITHKKFEEALHALTLAKNINPNDYTILTQAGDIFYTMKDYDKADRMYKKAIKMAPGIADTHLQYGIFLQDAYKTPDLAIKAYKKAIRLPTKDTNVLEILERRVLQTRDKKLQQSLAKRLQTT